MKRLIGILFLLVGAPVAAFGILLIGLGGLEFLLEHDDGEAALACFCGVLAGSIPASIGFVLCLVSRALFQGSEASPPRGGN